MISEWYQVKYSLGRRRWFIYKIVRYERLHETIDNVLRIDGVEEIKIEMYGDGNMGTTGIHVLLCEPMLVE